MPDIITPEEQNAIAQAITEGRVRHIPRGVSAFEVGEAQVKLSNGFTKRKMAAAERRRDKLIPDLMAGMITSELAKKYNVSTHTVRNDIKARLGEIGWDIATDNWNQRQSRMKDVG